VAVARPPKQRRALLVADPRGDLPGAAAESVAVRHVLQLGPRPWTIDELSTKAASLDAVRKRLAGADLFHYAGHGSFSGFGGWDSTLLLAGNTHLILGDLLALDSLPRWVVLSGCDTGRSSAEAPVAGLGLAHAFLLAGSEAVVASTRPTDDRTLPTFFTDLYQEWQQHGDLDLGTALQRAQLAWRKQNPAADWASFRLFEQ
jgi:CHAT domain-containing protein